MSMMELVVAQVGRSVGAGKGELSGERKRRQGREFGQIGPITNSRNRVHRPGISNSSHRKFSPGDGNDRSRDVGESPGRCPGQSSAPPARSAFPEAEVHPLHGTSTGRSLDY